ncbi:MAG: efflux transporter outer membrane subunit [Desulfobacteraceae bacterium]|nr:MAG: efflux transporter outer membrane subunit [Desulfobacteraceae bacterium]
MMHRRHMFCGPWNILAIVLTVLALAGCAAVGPDYFPPRMEVPAELAGEVKLTAFDVAVEADDPARWWTAFDDPVLTEIIERAVSENQDMKKALARLNEARARRGLRRAEFYPGLDASAAATRSRSGGANDSREYYSAGFDAGWEIDVFGGVRRSVAAADADLEAVEAGLGDVRVSLAAETALNYVEVRTLQARLKTADENLAAQTETSDLVGFRLEAGLTNELAFHQARYQLESTRSQIPALLAALDAAKNRLAILTGRPPGAIDDLLAHPQEVLTAPHLALSGIPADTLRRRPDIRRAERELAAQTERIGVASADLYPRFTLSGAIGFESVDAGDLITADSRFWHIGPGVSWKVFDAGAVRRNIDIQSALQEQYLAAYEQTVLSALEEVKNAMTAYTQDRIRQESLRQAVDAARSAEALAREYYLSGMADFSDVLDAQRAVFSFENQLAENRGAVAGDLIRLYKALGGGWTPAGLQSPEAN